MAPGDGGLFDPSGDGKDHPGEVINTYDNDASTTWSTRRYPHGLDTKPGVGIWVKAPTTTSSRGVGILDRKPGFDVEIYASNDQGATTSPSLNSWGSPVATRTNVSARQRLALPKGAARNAAYYLVWITKLPSGNRAVLQEIQLLQ